MNGRIELKNQKPVQDVKQDLIIEREIDFTPKTFYEFIKVNNLSLDEGIILVVDEYKKLKNYLGDMMANIQRRCYLCGRVCYGKSCHDCFKKYKFVGKRVNNRKY